jgi:hypothetical protein
VFAVMARDSGKLTEDLTLFQFGGLPIARSQSFHNFFPSRFADYIHALPFLGNILLRQRSRLGNKNYESMRRAKVIVAISFRANQNGGQLALPAA